MCVLNQSISAVSGSRQVLEVTPGARPFIGGVGRAAFQPGYALAYRVGGQGGSVRQSLRSFGFWAGGGSCRQPYG